MIVFVIDIGGVFPDNGKGHPPVPARFDGPRSLAISLELMKVQSGEAQIFRGSGGV